MVNFPYSPLYILMFKVQSQFCWHTHQDCADGWQILFLYIVILFRPLYPTLSPFMAGEYPICKTCKSQLKNIPIQKSHAFLVFPNDTHMFHGNTISFELPSACVNLFKKALKSTFLCPGFKPSTTLGMARSTSYLAQRTSSLFTKSWLSWGVGRCGLVVHLQGDAS